jgi:hypothetical protein
MFRMLIDVPAHWLDILKLFTTDRVMIAGGALRDLHHGVAIKDLDIFIYGPVTEGNVLFELPVDWALDYSVIAGESSAPMRGIAAVANYITGNAEHINLISAPELPDFETVLKRMDFGICQIGMGKDGIVKATQAYLDDFNGDSFTYQDNGYADAEQSWVRWNRLKVKYPDHKLIGLEVPVP